VTISRRGFLGTTAGLAISVPALTGRVLERSTLQSQSPPLEADSREAATCVLLDSSTPLRESIAGFQATLAAAGSRFITASSNMLLDLQMPRVAIVPGFVMLEPFAVSWLAAVLEAGGLVVIESGAPFTEKPAVAWHHDLLSSEFGVDLRPPVNLWEEGGNRVPYADRVPYVDYVWPITTKVRDFSRITPLRNESAGVVARAGSLPVALRRKVGRGTLIFLGSPLGPALLAGDREARGWLREALRRC
jgi:hypothetical protein